jgi:hypothetical protein
MDKMRRAQVEVSSIIVDAECFRHRDDLESNSSTAPNNRHRIGCLEPYLHVRPHQQEAPVAECIDGRLEATRYAGWAL